MKTTLATSPAEATAQGFAEFNTCPHLCVNVPDSTFPISVKTSEGKRVTFSFLPYKTGGAPQCVDVCFHDNGTTSHRHGKDVPTFDVLAFGKGRDLFDSRKLEKGVKPAIVCVLMDGRSTEAN